MNHYAFLLMLFAHVLSDFYLQSNNIAQNKENLDKKGLGSQILHVLIYLLALIFFLIPFITLRSILICLILSILHFATDMLLRKKNLKLFLLDQSIHIFTLITASLFIESKIHSFFNNFILFFNVKFGDLDYYNFVLILLFVLINLKPINILITMIFTHCNLNNNIQEKGETKLRGSVIGIIERLLMFTLILCGEYLAGSIVIAVKSIGRIKKLEEPDFSDKFIIGSLVSILIAVLTSLIVKVYIKC